MKRFLLRSWLFVSTVLVTVGGVCGLETALELRCYRQELVAPEGTQVFVCGNSKPAMSLDPAVWTELFNFSHNGRPLDQTYLATIDILKANPGRFKTMLVDVAPESAYADYDAPIGDMGDASQFFLLYLLHWNERVRDLSGLVGVVRDALLFERLHLISRIVRGKATFRSSLASGFSPSESCWMLKRPELFEKSLQLWDGRTRELLKAPSARIRYFELLDRLVKLARDNGLEVVLMTTPWHQDLIRRVGADNARRFTDAVDRYAHRRCCRYLNLMEMRFPDECWLNGNHLNRRGSQVFTAEVKNRTRNG